jgi:hypothetical protein
MGKSVLDGNDTIPDTAKDMRSWDQGTKIMAWMPEFFEERGYVAPTDSRDGALQYAFATKKEAFEFWQELPGVWDNFNTFVAGTRGSHPDWFQWFPVKNHLLKGVNLDADSPFLVDIAGGKGQDIERFLKTFPDVTGRFVLEDLTPVIEDIKSLDPRIEKVQYDFYLPQPVKGKP